MKKLLFIFIAFISFSSAVQAAPISIDLPTDHVDITFGFSGTKMHVYGTYDVQGAVMLVVRGPTQDVTVYKKKPKNGIWMNSDSVEFLNVPSYYAYAGSAEFLKENNFDLESLTFNLKRKRDEGEKYNEFSKALVLEKQTQKLFPQSLSDLQIIQPGFFKATFYIPAQAVTGTYNITAYLVKKGEILAQTSADLRVAQVGFTGSLRRFAFDKALFYGFGMIMLAFGAGFAANAILRRD